MANEPKRIIIPDNIMSNKRILGFHKRNIVEGIIAFFIVLAIINQIPFVNKIKLIFIVVVGGSVFFLCCIGFKDKSPSELIMELVTYLKSPRVYHFRSIEYATKQRKTEFKSGEYKTQRSIAEKLYDYIKDVITTFIKEGKIDLKREK